MMKQHFFAKTAAVLLSAGILAFGGMSAAAAGADAVIDEVPAITAAAPAAPAAPTDCGEIPAVAAAQPDSLYAAADDYTVMLTDTDDDIIAEAPKKSKNWVKIILIALAVSLVITGITVYMIFRRYKYNGQTEPYEFKEKAPLELKEKEDVLIDVRVTSVHINRDNN